MGMSKAVSGKAHGALAGLTLGLAALGLPGMAKELALHGQRWAPWRSYAALHLWRARP